MRLSGTRGGLGRSEGAGDREQGQREPWIGAGVVGVTWFGIVEVSNQVSLGDALRTQGVRGVCAGAMKQRVRSRCCHEGGMWGRFRAAGGEELTGCDRGSWGQR